MNWNELTMTEITTDVNVFDELTVPVKWLNVQFSPVAVDLHDEIQEQPMRNEIFIWVNVEKPQTFDWMGNILIRKMQELLPRFRIRFADDAPYDARYTLWCTGWVTEDELLTIPKVLSYIDNIALAWKVSLAVRSSFSTGAATPAAMAPVSVERRNNRLEPGEGEK